MAYILPSTKAKRVKRIDQQGQEELEAEDKVAFQQSADAAAQVGFWLCLQCPCCADLDHQLRLPCPSQVVTAAAESDAEDAEAEQAPAAATPREVIEKLSAAKVTLTCEPHLWTGSFCLYCAFLTSTKHTLVTNPCESLTLRLWQKQLNVKQS